MPLLAPVTTATRPFSSPTVPPSDVQRRDRRSAQSPCLYELRPASCVLCVDRQSHPIAPTLRNRAISSIVQPQPLAQHLVRVLRRAAAPGAARRRAFPTTAPAARPPAPSRPPDARTRRARRARRPADGRRPVDRVDRADRNAAAHQDRFPLLVGPGQERCLQRVDERLAVRDARGVGRVARIARRDRQRRSAGRTSATACRCRRRARGRASSSGTSGTAAAPRTPCPMGRARCRRRDRRR